MGKTATETFEDLLKCSMPKIKYNCLIVFYKTAFSFTEAMNVCHDSPNWPRINKNINQKLNRKKVNFKAKLSIFSSIT